MTTTPREYTSTSTLERTSDSESEIVKAMEDMSIQEQ